jgi:acyl CoA:acetate/3-ketoacid CoA transferase alpha subunit
MNQPAYAAPDALAIRLADAVQRHVAPGMHLHFASTPARSNAAVREVARAFLGTRPAFWLSTTGFHSTMHLLPALGMAARLTACFFGDLHPAPRPNPLYTRLAADGVAIEHWALWSMVASLRAGAQGDDWVINRSLRGTTLAHELAVRGDYREITVPGVPDAPLPGRPAPSAARKLGLCTSLRPDVTFVHAAAADDEGRVIMASPLSEGLWSALAARRGVIVTVERLVSAAVTRAYPAAIALPPHRVLAICEAPFGAHPQPLRCAVELAIPSYRDDVEHYERWRTLADDPAGLAEFIDAVLRAPDAGAAYRSYVGAARLAALCEPERTWPVTGMSGVTAAVAAPEAPAPSEDTAGPHGTGDAGAAGAPGETPGFPELRHAREPQPPDPPPAPGLPAEPQRTRAGERDPAIDRLIVTGARRLVVRVRAIDARVVIAGIGPAFFAARLAQLQLAAAGYPLRVMVETGLHDVDAGAESHGYLLAYDNAFRARRLSAIDDMLGILACGADNRCLAVLGAAQIDRHGNLNCTRLAGELLVGSGGACDIAASVEEVVVMTRLAPGKLVDDVEYITSPGRPVASVVTDRAVLTRPRRRDTPPGGPTALSAGPRDRSDTRDTWTIASLAAARPDQNIEQAVAELVHDCPWPLTRIPDLGFAVPITAEEARLLDTLDPTGMHRQRAGIEWRQ